MIKVTDRFSIDADTFCFTVVEYYQGKTKQGEDAVRERYAYFPKLEQCLNYIRQQECKECENVEELLAALRKSYELDTGSVLSVLTMVKARRKAA